MDSISQIWHSHSSAVVPHSDMEHVVVAATPAARASPDQQPTPHSGKSKRASASPATPSSSSTGDAMPAWLTQHYDHKPMPQQQQQQTPKAAMSTPSPQIPVTPAAMVTTPHQAGAQNNNNTNDNNNNINNATDGNVYSEAYVRHLQNVVDQTRRHSFEIERVVANLAEQLETKHNECDELRRMIAQESNPAKSALQREHKERTRLEDEVAKLRREIDILEKEREKVEYDRDKMRERLQVMSRLAGGGHQNGGVRSEAVNTFFDRYVGKRNAANAKTAAPASDDTDPNRVSSWKTSNTGSVRRTELIRYLEMLDREQVTLLSREGAFDFVRVLCHRVIVRAAARERNTLCGVASQLVVDKKAGLLLAHEGLDAPPSLEGVVSLRPVHGEHVDILDPSEIPRSVSPPLSCERILADLYLRRMTPIAQERIPVDGSTTATATLRHFEDALRGTDNDAEACARIFEEFLAVCGLTRETPQHFHLESNPVVYFDMSVNGEFRGRIELELYRHVCPKTCENFMSLCIGSHIKPDGTVLTYKGSSIHAIMRNFAIFGGSSAPDGTVFGQPFPSESWSVLPDQPGRLVCENGGDPSHNTSCFCITASAWPEDLSYRATCFGQVITNVALVEDLARCPTSVGEAAEHSPVDQIVIANCGIVHAN
eukprot:PhM_4_TR13482/c0_g1_i1/m.17704